MSTTRQKLIGTIFIALSIIFAGLALYFYFQNSNSQAKIIENNAKIKKLEESKLPLLDTIEANTKAIKEKDKIIQSYKENEKKLLQQLETNQNEKVKETSTYINSSTDKRVELFTKLTE